MPGRAVLEMPSRSFLRTSWGIVPPTPDVGVADVQPAGTGVFQDAFDFVKDFQEVIHVVRETSFETQNSFTIIRPRSGGDVVIPHCPIGRGCDHAIDGFVVQLFQTGQGIKIVNGVEGEHAIENARNAYNRSTDLPCSVLPEDFPPDRSAAKSL